LMRSELPNLRRAWVLLLQAGKIDAASIMANTLARFFISFGLLRDHDQLRQRLTEAMQNRPLGEGGLTQAEFLHEIDTADAERHRGQLHAAIRRLMVLLARIEVQQRGVPRGRDSFEHCQVLLELVGCLRESGQLSTAESMLGKAFLI